MYKKVNLYFLLNCQILCINRIFNQNYSFCFRGTEVAVGGSKVDIKCFADCGEEFNLTMIKVSIYFLLLA